MTSSKPHIGLGLHATRSSTMTPLAVTAPASPTEEMTTNSKPLLSRDHTASTPTSFLDPMPPHTTIGQFTFGPATQQTVTTVTTTTTVSLPPLIMKPPRDLLERDPKQYPLAFLPTPSSINRFCFDASGRPTEFHEVEDAAVSSGQYNNTQALASKSNDSIRDEGKPSGYATPDKDVVESLHNNRVQEMRQNKSLKRTATPPSIAEAAELASLQRRSKKRRSHLHRSFIEQSELPSLNDRASVLSFPADGNMSPITPDTEGVTLTAPVKTGASIATRSHLRPPSVRLALAQDVSDDMQLTDSESLVEEDEVRPPSRKRGKKRGHSTLVAASNTSTHTAGSSSTNPSADSSFETETETRRPRLSNILTSSQRDASLPSPSLSPITAAANLASRRSAFDAFEDNGEEDGDAMSGVGLEDSSKVSSAKSFASLPGIQQPSDQYPFAHAAAQQTAGPTIMDIPTMVEAFDSMPMSMQTYLIYQFLRRCAKPTLQMVANVVNPALKCDPFNVLPPELGLNILRFLDAQSMCRASQVSKRWRRLVNTDERKWKNLLEEDGFVLPDGEIARAVREGWGWQHPGVDGFERDLSRPLRSSTPEVISDVTVISDDELPSTTVAARANRKWLTGRSSGSKKSRRRHLNPSASSAKASAPSDTVWLKMLSSSRGANSLALLAAQAVPHPSHVGLNALRQMHLFKSLYQRHYLIRKAWMDEEREPQHLAFRAHHRHVVTCLLFDSDKILTGSDDTKINVYDTKTGALRSRLEGHEGGVWALQYDEEILVSGSTDRSVRVWDINNGRLLHIFQGHTSTVRCLVILKPVQIGTEADGTPIMMPKEPLIITGSRDSTLRVWKLPRVGDRSIFQQGPPTNDSDNPYFIRTLTGHHNSVRAIAAHGDRLVSGSYDCTVRVWKISTGDLIHRLQGHTQKVYSVVLDHPRNRCISGSMDNLVKIWDLYTGSMLFNLEGHTSLVGLLDLSNDRLVSAAADSTLRVWDPETGTCRATLSAHTGAITCFQHDGQKVISGSDRTLKMWNVRNGECVRDLLTDLSGVWQVRFDERRCVAAVQRNSLTYIEVLDFGASREGVPASRLGRRIVVDARGREVEDVEAVVEVEPQRPTAN